MASLNTAARELVLKIVYYGPGLCGKTTTLATLHEAAPTERRGKLVSLATPVDRTLYFDFLPLRLPPLRGLSVRLQLFTVPGQVYFNATRRLVLSGADGVVFVADSQVDRLDANLESLENLRDNLAEHGRDLATIPHAFQWNKQDLDDLVPVEELDTQLNLLHAPAFGTIATRGDGVQNTLDAITKAVLDAYEAQMPAAAQSLVLEPRPTRRATTLASFDAKKAIAEAEAKASAKSGSGSYPADTSPGLGPSAAEASHPNTPAVVQDATPTPLVASVVSTDAEFTPLASGEFGGREVAPSTQVSPGPIKIRGASVGIRSKESPTSRSSATVKAAINRSDRVDPPMSRVDLRQYLDGLEPMDDDVVTTAPKEPQRRETADSESSSVVTSAVLKTPSTGTFLLDVEAIRPNQPESHLPPALVQTETISTPADDTLSSTPSQRTRPTTSSPESSGNFSFVALFAPNERSLVAQIEASLAHGAYGDAVGMCEAALGRLLAHVASTTEDDLGLATLLGLHGHEILRFRAAVRAARAGDPIPPDVAHAAYGMLVYAKVLARRL